MSGAAGVVLVPATALLLFISVLLGVGLRLPWTLATAEAAQATDVGQPLEVPATDEVLVGSGIRPFPQWDRSGGWETFTDNDGKDIAVYHAMGLGRASIGDISWRDYTLTTRYKIYEYGQWGVFRVYVRYQGPYQGYGLNILPDTIQLVRFDGRWDQVRILATAAAPSRLNVTYQLRIRVEGNGRLTVDRDGHRLFVCTDPAQEYGGGGVCFGPEAVSVVLSDIHVDGTRLPRSAAEKADLQRFVNAWQARRASAATPATPATSYPGYLLASEVQPAGVHHIILIYNGVYAGGLGDWTESDALPYVAHVVSAAGSSSTDATVTTNTMVDATVTTNATADAHATVTTNATADATPATPASSSPASTPTTTTGNGARPGAAHAPALDGWFFDTILVLGLSAPSGGNLGGSAPGATQAEWRWYLDKTFGPDGDLAAFERATAQAATTLHDPAHHLNVILMLPYPSPDVASFGDVDGDGRTDSFAATPPTTTQAQAEASRLQALRWYIGEALQRWNAAQYSHLRLVGWYWVSESIDGPDTNLVKQVAEWVHDLPLPTPPASGPDTKGGEVFGSKLYWIPWFNAPGSDHPTRVALDYTMMQPNYMFLPQIPRTRLAMTAELADRYHLGLEIEADSSVLSSASGRERYYDYLRAGRQFGFMTHALVSYYQDVKALLEACRSTDPEVRRVYDATFQFVQGTFDETLY